MLDACCWGLKFTAKVVSHSVSDDSGGRKSRKRALILRALIALDNILRNYVFSSVAFQLETFSVICNA